MPEPTSLRSYLIDAAGVCVTVLLILSLIARELAAAGSPRFQPLVRRLKRLILPLLVLFVLVVTYRLALLLNPR